MGAEIVAHDPEAIETFRERFGDRSGITYAATNYEALEGADALVVCTEWNAYRHPSFEKLKSMLKSPVVFDGRNIFDAEIMRDHGFEYFSIGRPKLG